MKNIKKILACAMAVVSLCSITVIPMNANAIIYKDDVSTDNIKSYIVIDKTDAMENGPFIIVIKNQDDEEIDRVIFDYISKEVGEFQCIFPSVEKVDDTVDISNATKEIIAYVNNDSPVLDIYIDFDKEASSLEWWQYNVVSGAFEGLEVLITKDMLENENTTVGDSESTSITEFTVGESTYPRGDINLDGNVNTVDLLMLKKYLLGLMEW